MTTEASRAGVSREDVLRAAIDFAVESVGKSREQHFSMLSLTSLGVIEEVLDQHVAAEIAAATEPWRLLWKALRGLDGAGNTPDARERMRQVLADGDRLLAGAPRETA
jgi:hypothetical protein